LFSKISKQIFYFSYLATGDRLHSISLNYRIGRSTATLIIKETCEAIWDLSSEELFTPSEKGWREIAHEFEKRWNFLNCIGAMDGKHVAIIVRLYQNKYIKL